MLWSVASVIQTTVYRLFINRAVGACPFLLLGDPTWARVRADADGQGHGCKPDRGMDEPADPCGSDSSRLLAFGAVGVAVGDQAQHGQVPTCVVLADRGESELIQAECGVEAGRGKVVHQGPWVVMES